MAQTEQATFTVGDLVTTPRNGIGTVASQVYTDPIDGLDTCLVRLPDMGTIAFSVIDLALATVEDAWNALQDAPGLGDTVIHTLTGYQGTVAGLDESKLYILWDDRTGSLVERSSLIVEQTARGCASELGLEIEA